VVPPNQLRFSLAGMQLKFSMSMANERLTLGASGAGAKWIVKLPSYRFLDLPEVECATLTWARNAGFDVPGHCTLSADDLGGVPASWRDEIPQAFAIKRFDRRDDGSKIHQEDLCQALELSPFHKYGDSGARRISLDGALRFVADVAGDDNAREMARRVGFVIASGNGDAHLKNWSFLWGNADRPSLAPCYDFVATVSWADRFGWDLPIGPSLSLGLGGERRFGRINTLVLDHHVERSGCPWAKDEILSGIERARDAWASSVEAMPELMRRALETHWERVPLLSGMLRG
jgi:serine/threonine-protein kinase HipA